MRTSLFRLRGRFVLTLLLASGCEESSKAEEAPPTPEESFRAATVARAVEAARSRAAWYCAQTWSDPTALLLGDILYRRFGVTACASMGEAYLGEAAGFEAMVEPDRTVLSRIVSGSVECSDADTAGLQLEWNRVVAPPLCCPLLPLTETWRAEADALMDDRGYGTTHVAIGVAWARELNCSGGLTDTQQQRLEQELALLITTPPATFDLLGEVVLANVLVRGAQSVPTEMVARILDAEGPLGWSDAPHIDLPNWHTNAVICWGLLEWAGVQQGWLTAARSAMP
jgi:hypothetical protein